MQRTIEVCARLVAGVRAVLVETAQRRVSWALAPVLLAVTLLGASAARLYGDGDVVPGLSGGKRAPLEADALLERARRTAEVLEAAERYYEREVAPLESVLLRYRNDPVLVHRIALSLVREASRAGLEPRLLLAVMLVENPGLDPRARSVVGARGLMQVMPLHEGRWSACRGDPGSVETNICYGAQIFADNLRRSGGNVERALLAYNGCVRGTNTPNCHEYPNHVYARAGRASIQAWAQGADR